MNIDGIDDATANAAVDAVRSFEVVTADGRILRASSEENPELFFALRGDTFDGNRFVAEALEKGAAYAVSDDPQVAASDERQRIVLVDDTLKALQDLARCHRRALGIPILAISGSNGKTTTKELVSRVLAERVAFILGLIIATRFGRAGRDAVPCEE